MIGNTTRLVAMIGTPIAQVKSPENFNTFFAASHEDRAMIPIDLRPEQVEDFVRSVRGWENLDGFVVLFHTRLRLPGCSMNSLRAQNSLAPQMSSGATRTADCRAT